MATAFGFRAAGRRSESHGLRDALGVITPVEGARKALTPGQPTLVTPVQPGSCDRSSPLASLEPGQLEAVAEIIASPLRRAGEARPTSKQLVTARQAAELLAVDLKTVCRHAKELGGPKVGGAWRFDLDATAMDDATEPSARYASERPRPSKRPAAWGGKHPAVRKWDPSIASYCPSGVLPTGILHGDERCDGRRNRGSG